MNRLFIILFATLIFSGCQNFNKPVKRTAVAKVGDAILYYDEIPQIFHGGSSETDSMAIIQNYINKWAKKELLLQKAEENLSAELKSEIGKQIEETKSNLVIYQYQRQMMLEKMDTVVTEEELENYYITNEKSFILNSNIVKALFIKLPVETPDIDKIRILSRSNDQKDLQLLENYCFQFAEKFDDFNEKWVTMDRLLVELKEDFGNQEYFLKRNTYFETSDSSSVYMITIRDYRLRSSLAPYEYIKDDIKRIIWNNRRFQFIQSLENGIFNDALKENVFKIY
jgi:hypothetical protein